MTWIYRQAPLARLFRFKSLTYHCEPVPPIKKRLPFICDLKLPIQCSFRFFISLYKPRLAVHPPKRLGLTVSSAKSRAVPCNRKKTKRALCGQERGYEEFDKVIKAGGFWSGSAV